jgi:hypothetical protein
MPSPLRPIFRFFFAALLTVPLLCPAHAGERDDFQTAIEEASAQCRVALQILETESQQDTAAAVHRFRHSWQRVIERRGAAQSRPAPDDAAMFLDVDMRIVGTLLIIDLGNRDAARSALEAIEAIVADLSARSAERDR